MQENNIVKKWNIGWGVISSCNMNGQFFYSKFRRTENNDLSFNDWINFIDNNYMYIGTINYGTGENSLRDEWFELVKHVKDNYPEIKQALTSNGYVYEAIKNDDYKRNIILSSIDEIDVSLDFFEEKKHNEFRGQEKAYQWAINTLRFCSENNIRSTIVFLGSAVNAYEENIDGIFKIAKQYGALLRMNIYRPTEGINPLSEQFIIEPQKIVNILRYISKKYSVLSISDALYSNLLTNCFEEDPSGIDSIRILPNGDITPSTYLINEEFVVGNIQDQHILQHISEDRVFDDIISEAIPKECNHCRYVVRCKGGVYDRRLLWNKTLEKKDPYCTYTPGESEWEKIVVKNKNFESVHHGYLPTMFFEP